MLCFSMKIELIEIEDSIESHKTMAIEVSVVTSEGDRSWCFFLTPEGISASGDFIEGTKVRFHYGAAHMVIPPKNNRS